MMVMVSDHLLIPLLVGAVLMIVYEVWALYDMIWRARHNVSRWDEQGNERSDLSRACERAQKVRWSVILMGPVVGGIALTTAYNALRILVMYA